MKQTIKKFSNLLTLVLLAYMLVNPIVAKAASYNYTIEGVQRTISVINGETTLTVGDKSYTLTKQLVAADAALDEYGTAWILFKNGAVYWWAYDLEKDSTQVEIHKLFSSTGNQVYADKFLFEGADEVTITGYQTSSGSKFSILTFEELKAILDVDNTSDDSTNSGSTDTNTGSDTNNSGSTDTNTGSDTNNSGSTDTNTGSNTDNSGSTDINTGSNTDNSGSTDTNTGSNTDNSGSTDTNTGSNTDNSGSTDTNTGSNTDNSGSTDTNTGSNTNNTASTTTSSTTTESNDVKVTTTTTTTTTTDSNGNTTKTSSTTTKKETIKCTRVVHTGSSYKLYSNKKRLTTAKLKKGKLSWRGYTCKKIKAIGFIKKSKNLIVITKSGKCYTLDYDDMTRKYIIGSKGIKKNGKAIAFNYDKHGFVTHVVTKKPKRINVKKK